MDRVTAFCLAHPSLDPLAAHCLCDFTLHCTPGCPLGSREEVSLVPGCIAVLHGPFEGEKPVSPSETSPTNSQKEFRWTLGGC